jgi:hypothetical protein
MNVYNRYLAMVSRQRISIAVRRINEVSMYIRRTRAIPETIAENRNTTGINGVDHQGFALIEPKMKPT